MNPNSPVTLRLDAEQREQLSSLAGEGPTSNVLRDGLQALVRTRRAGKAPLYPKLVTEADIAEAVARAASAAVEVLDELFAGQPAETRGIGSNFHGLLEEHLTVMLTGREASLRCYSRELNPLLADEEVFGRMRSLRGSEGYCLQRSPERHGESPLYLDSDRNSFRALEKIEAGSLFTNTDVAVKAGLSWLKNEELSPRDCSLRLCILAWPDEGPLTLAELATLP